MFLENTKPAGKGSGKQKKPHIAKMLRWLEENTDNRYLRKRNVEIFRMYYSEDMFQKDIAAQYGISSARVSSVILQTKYRVHELMRLPSLATQHDTCEPGFKPDYDIASVMLQPQDEQKAAELTLLLHKPLGELGVSVLLLSRMMSIDALFLGDMLRFSADDLMTVRYFGRTALQEVKTLLAAHGLKLKE